MTTCCMHLVNVVLQEQASHLHLRLQARVTRQTACASVTIDAPSSPAGAQVASARDIRSANEHVRHRSPKLAGKTVVVSGGSQVCNHPIEGDSTVRRLNVVGLQCCQ